MHGIPDDDINRHDYNTTNGTVKQVSDVAERLMALIPTNTHSHVTYDPNPKTFVVREQDGKIKPSYRTVTSAVTSNIWAKHLAGEYPLVAGLMCDDCSTRVSVVDIDDYTINTTQITIRLQRLRLPFYIRPSKSGGAHIYVFHATAISVAESVKVSRGIARLLGYADKDAGIEYFPRQQKDDTEPKCLNMPFFRNQDGFINVTGGRMLAEEFVLIVEFLTDDQRATIIETKEPRKAKPTELEAGRKYAERKLDEYANELKNTPLGSRNNKLTERAYWMGQMVARGWITRSDIEKEFRAAIAHWDDQGKTLDTLVRSIRDGEAKPHEDLSGADVAIKVRATPYIHTAPNLLKPRGGIYEPGYIRKFISMTVATSKVGKSSKAIVEALAMVTGKPLLGIHPHSISRVWYWNGEDPLDEINKRVAAAMKHYGITEQDIGGRLFIDSGRDMPIKIAEIGRNGITIAVPTVKGVTEALMDNQIDVFMGDPFVSTHRVTENDNNAMQQVTEQWAHIADITNNSIRLYHHTRKTNGDAVDFESQRGASSNHAAVRYAEVLNYMSEKEAEDAGINPARRKFYFREDFESNLFPPAADNAVWYEKVSVDLENAADGFESDKIGVVTQWEYPQADNTDITLTQQGAIRVALREREAWRADPQAKDWVGVPIANVLGVDLNLKAMRKRIKGIIDKLEAWGDLHPVTMKVNRVEKEGYTARPLQEGLGL